jgi:hypothetical protein
MLWTRTNCSGRVTLVFYRKRAFEKEYAGAGCSGALSIKPLEGSRSRGESDGISMCEMLFSSGIARVKCGGFG